MKTYTYPNNPVDPHYLFRTRDKRIVGFHGQHGIPFLLVNDLELVGKVLVEDFDHFVDRFNAKERTNGAVKPLPLLGPPDMMSASEGEGVRENQT